jgi:glucosamine-6-phosphate deaminase
VDFAKVTTVNLDEYYPISPEHPQSYRYFMNDNLFNHINIPIENTHVPNGAAENAAIACTTYDRLIEQVGGIDLALLGGGNNGHIAFNEPGETLTVGTHRETLTENTREANSRFFDSMDEVPTHALTMGMGNILSANKIVILATGKAKADAVKAMLDDKITTNCPATLLKVHKDVTLICDRAAFEGKDL